MLEISYVAEAGGVLPVSGDAHHSGNFIDLTSFYDVHSRDSSVSLNVSVIGTNDPLPPK